MAFLIVFIEAFVNVLAQALTLAVFVRVIMSWVPMKLPWGLGEFVLGITEPILAPIRRALPFMGGMDFSPIIAFFLIQFLASVVLRVLPPTL